MDFRIPHRSLHQCHLNHPEMSKHRFPVNGTPQKVQPQMKASSCMFLGLRATFHLHLYFGGTSPFTKVIPRTFTRISKKNMLWKTFLIGISNFRGLLLMFQKSSQPIQNSNSKKDVLNKKKMFRVNLSSQQMKSEIQNPTCFPPFWADEATSITVTF